VALPALDSTDGALETAKTVEQSINVESAETVATTVSEQTQEAIDTTSQLITNATSTSNNEQPLKIVEATFKSDKNLTDLTSGLTASAPTNEPAKDIEPIGVPVEVMVSGTYYPKAVYNDADFSSSLLMRVSPGTTLQVSRAFGTWFEVNTSKGRGFVHQRDIK